MSESPPAEFVCPISLDVMRCPLIASDGFSYDHESITQWLAKHPVSPMTREPMSPNSLQFNVELMNQIKKWKDSLVVIVIMD